MLKLRQQQHQIAANMKHKINANILSIFTDQMSLPSCKALAVLIQLAMSTQGSANIFQTFQQVADRMVQNKAIPTMANIFLRSLHNKKVVHVPPQATEAAAAAAWVMMSLGYVKL